MIIHRDESMVELAGRRYPAVGLVCPPADGVDEPRSERTLGGPNKQPNEAHVGPSIEIYIPCENGILIEVTQYHDRMGLELVLFARTCRLDIYWADDDLWLPQPLSVFGGRIMREPDRSFIPSHWHRWDNATQEWACEHIDRLSRMAYDEPGGPRCELVSLTELWELLAA